MSDGEHFGSDTVHLAQSKLVDFVGGEIADSGASADVVQIAAFAARKRRDGECGTTVGNILGGDEAGERLIGRQHLVIGDVGNLLGEALLIRGGDTGGKLLRRRKKGVGRDDAIALHWNLFQQKPDRHEVVLHTGAENLFGLREDAWDLVKASDVVLIPLYRVEGNSER